MKGAFDVSIKSHGNGVRLRLDARGQKKLAADEGTIVLVSVPSGDIYRGIVAGNAIEIEDATAAGFESPLRIRRLP